MQPRSLLTSLIALSLFLAASVGAAEKGESPLDRVKWQRGPGKVSLGKHAEINVPEGYQFTAAEGTQRLLQLMGNPTSGAELGFLAPTNMDWFVVFEFNDVGYVKDDEKDQLNADKMLEAIRRGTEEANKERKEMGVPGLTITGWMQPPRYNEKTHNLEWAINGESEGEKVVNWNTRLLGRRGVMEVSLVIDPAALPATMPIYQKLMADYDFKDGERYAEYQQGDKVAQYGLAALVLGGAAVGAAKLGLLAGLIAFFKKGWKLIVIGVIAVAGFVKKLIFGGGRRNTPE